MVKDYVNWKIYMIIYSIYDKNEEIKEPGQGEQQLMIRLFSLKKATPAQMHQT